ncbi:hypothetical protein ACFHWD_03730 [Clostridium sp. MT-14]|uniref:hypothetical protein n=1 Tax=Clostridium sp. MT-14 TaxID=3348360 RepID=UPI0035F42977
MDKKDLQEISELLDQKFDKKLESIKLQLDENTQILKALVHSTEVSKAERDKMSNDIAHIKGSITNINENMDAVKEILGRHEVDITVLKRRPV